MATKELVNADGSPAYQPHSTKRATEKTRVIKATARDIDTNRPFASCTGASEIEAIEALAELVSNAGNPARSDKILNTVVEQAKEIEALKAQAASLQAKLSASKPEVPADGEASVAPESQPAKSGKSK
jgi:hypothetical protein